MESVWDAIKKCNCFIPVFASFTLSVLYVLSLYIWRSPYNRDHPSTIKKRFFGVFLMLFIAPSFVYCFIQNNENLSKHSLFELLGIRWAGLLPAAILPLLLTMVLFLGPIAMQFQSDFLDLYSEPKYWISNFRNLIWLRNYIIAPFSEELTFRACMLPLLIQCFRPQAAIFICPLFFGIAHLHHIIGCIKEGMNVKTALLVSGFQFTYTTIFGAYSAFLFLRTGHFVASLFAHTFCNYMGFPQFVELYGYSEPKRTIIVVLCLVGFVLWCVLLSPLTTPSWYKNHLFWKVYS